MTSGSVARGERRRAVPAADAAANRSVAFLLYIPLSTRRAADRANRRIAGRGGGSRVSSAHRSRKLFTAADKNRAMVCVHRPALLGCA